MALINNLFSQENLDPLSNPNIDLSDYHKLL